MAEAKSVLYEHTQYAHVPRDINKIHHDERFGGNAIQRFNAWLAVHATVITSSVWCFYFFLIISGTGFPGIPWVTCTPQAFVAWFSSQFLQLVLLPLIAAGTVIVGRHQELQAEEIYRFSQRSVHTEEQMIRHLNAQDEELLKQTALLVKLAEGHADTATIAELHTKLDKLHERMQGKHLSPNVVGKSKKASSNHVPSDQSNRGKVLASQ